MTAPSRGTSTLSSDDLQRYARHLTLPEIGVRGQEALKRARVLLVGAGGLGSPAALYLAAAGVGTLGIVDADIVDVSNLQRQILHDTTTIGMRKTDSAQARLRALNPLIRIETIAERLVATGDGGDRVRALIRGFDLVIDGSDNFPTRYLINDACVLEGRPLVYGSIFRFEGQVSLFATPGGPCYRCLFADPPPPELVPSCVEAGVLGVLPGIVGSLQALEAIKWITGAGQSTAGRLILFDALALRMREIGVARDPACPVCGDAPTVTELIDYDAFCGVTPAGPEGDGLEISPAQLRNRLNGGAPPLLLDVREPWEFDLVHLEGAVLLPLGELPERLRELDPRREIVAICHHGLRSRTARDVLRHAGFGTVRNLTGGMDAWAASADTAMRRY